MPKLYFPHLRVCEGPLDLNFIIRGCACRLRADIHVLQADSRKKYKQTYYTSGSDPCTYLFESTFRPSQVTFCNKEYLTLLSFDFAVNNKEVINWDTLNLKLGFWSCTPQMNRRMSDPNHFCRGQNMQVLRFLEMDFSQKSHCNGSDLITCSWLTS